MSFRLLADLVVVIHLAFVVFVVAGGLLTIRWPAVCWVHLPAAIWGGWIEFSGDICPLTPIENSLRQRAGDAIYAGDFVSHYLLAVLYPSGLTRPTQWILGVLVVGVNAAVYWWGWSRRRAGRAVASPRAP